MKESRFYFLLFLYCFLQLIFNNSCRNSKPIDSWTLSVYLNEEVPKVKIRLGSKSGYKVQALGNANGFTVTDQKGEVISDIRITGNDPSTIEVITSISMSVESENQNVYLSENGEIVSYIPVGTWKYLIINDANKKDS